MSVCRRVGAVVTCSTWWAFSGSHRSLAGYEDTNDAERLANDPTMRVSREVVLKDSAASTNTCSRFETEVLPRTATWAD